MFSHSAVGREEVVFYHSTVGREGGRKRESDKTKGSYKWEEQVVRDSRAQLVAVNRVPRVSPEPRGRSAGTCHTNSGNANELFYLEEYHKSMRNSITDSASRTSQCAYRVRIVCERPRPPERLSDN